LRRDAQPVQGVSQESPPNAAGEEPHLIDDIEPPQEGGVDGVDAVCDPERRHGIGLEDPIGPGLVLARPRRASRSEIPVAGTFEDVLDLVEEQQGRGVAGQELLAELVVHEPVFSLIPFRI
jgi:hypothetical protein